MVDQIVAAFDRQRLLAMQEMLGDVLSRLDATKGMPAFQSVISAG